MNGILNYAAPRERSRKAMTYGIVSTGIATVVFALPMAISGAAALLQMIYARPGRLILHADLGLMIVLLSTLAMLLLPLLGLLFAGLSVAINKRDCEYALIGVIINMGGLIAGLGAVFLR